ncbi:CDP-glycerol glycerophosphotransferase family protein [Kineococcus sp. SYSU DK004]|uniref:CDP-glycerol glycerophosphotransferase family protein n=1 Tax=Kineococcus sp. SYSU DK004 TaxID=3383125 RepID=UPI003D7E2E41
MKIVYYSFGGRYADNPRAIHQRLLARGAEGVEHVWLAGPGRTFPPGTVTAAWGTPETVAALESADLVVADNHLPAFRKKPGATYLQTWHGTPLKRIHRDAVFTQPDGEDVMRRLDDDVTRWDVLLVPSDAAHGPLTGAFRYTGHAPVTGYPRNDALVGEPAARRREEVRERLGIPAGRTAVLYAPTWRDDERFGDGPDFRLALDLDRFHQRLGDDAVLLLRLHYLVAGALGTVDAPGVLDVSAHPDINDLYLAADVLVSDYSSAQFDFAVTGKPVVSYVYDIERYRDSLRGFYFDPYAIAPGPMLTTTEEVLDAVADLDALRAEHADRYRVFRQRFCHREDGRSADRVLDLVLSPAPAPMEVRS